MKVIRVFLFFIIILHGAILVSGQTHVPAGPVSGTWDIAGSPYMVNGEIYIDDPDTLTIEPGVEVRFTGWYKFIVRGSLLVEGTAADQILLTADDTNNRWHGIRFMYATGTSVLDHCVVEYGLTKLGGPFADPDYFGGGVLCYFSAAASITIKNSIIRNNIADIGGGIQCYNSSIIIDNCEIIHNEAYWGGGIEAENTSGAVILKSSTIAYNSASSYGGGIFAAIHANMEIIGNVIIHNTAGHYGGGIRILQPSGLIVRENIIAHNHAWWDAGGIGIWNADTIGTFEDNTIAYNHAVEDGGGVFIAMNCSPSFESDILYFNTSGNSGMNQVHLNGTGGAPYFNYCDVQDSYTGFSGIGAPSFPHESNYLDCIDADPLFADPEDDDFCLTWTNYPVPDNTRSPCIDSGKPGIITEPDGTYNDIGAFSLYQELQIPLALYADSISHSGFLARWTYANPAAGYFLDVAEDEAFSIWVLESRVVDSVTSYYAEDLDPATTYYYRVRAFNPAQQSAYSNTEDVTTLATGIEPHEIADVKLYPNPTSGVVHLRYTIRDIQYTKLELYSIRGVRIKSLLDEKQQAGDHEHEFDVSALPDGMYFLRIQLGEDHYVRKIVVVH